MQNAIVRYRVEAARRHEHLFDVEARFPEGLDALDLWMASWTPGSYLIREYARHVQDFRATDASGAVLAVSRAAKDTWRVDNPSGGEITVRYRVYANELTVRTSYLDGRHGYFNGASLFITNDALRSLPCELSLGLPAGWRTFCALPEREGLLQAADFDELVDSPVEIGPHCSVTFLAGGKAHELVVAGSGELDLDRLARDLAKVCETAISLFVHLPLERYLFIVHLTEKSRGGLEHRASSSLQWPRFGLRPGKGYEDFLALAAHEYFHLWNVKRILPRAFVPLDYRSEQYTRLLWAMEGITSYYDLLLVRRAGFVDARRYLEKLGETITAVESLPGRRVLSVEESSLIAWIKLYRPDENTASSSVSYYTKGEIVAMLLDLRIRAATEGRKSLDDIMRLLFERYGDGRGVPEDGIEAICGEVAEQDLSGFFDRSIRSAEELDYDVLASAGLQLRRRAKTGGGDRGGTAADDSQAAWLGVELKPGERAIVSVSFSREGLYAGDEIIALDGYRVNATGLQERIGDRQPGERVRLTIFRNDELLELDLPVEARPKDACYLEKLPAASEEQKARFGAWLGESFG